VMRRLTTASFPRAAVLPSGVGEGSFRMAVTALPTGAFAAVPTATAAGFVLGLIRPLTLDISDTSESCRSTAIGFFDPATLGIVTLWTCWGRTFSAMPRLSSTCKISSTLIDPSGSKASVSSLIYLGRLFSSPSTVNQNNKPLPSIPKSSLWCEVQNSHDAASPPTRS
jgi:hypothetical protein